MTSSIASVAIPSAEGQSAREAATRPYPAILHTLTSLRYFAALWVVFFHYRAYYPSAVFTDSPFAVKGNMGVDFFFVLSGFVLAHVYLAQIETRRFDYWGFMVRRFARIYPLHALTLAAALGLGVLAARLHWGSSLWALDEWMHMPHGMLQRILFGQITLIHAWGAADGLHFNLPSWSISAEWFAYLTFPVTVLLVCRQRIPPMLVLAILGLATVALDVLSVRFMGRSLLLSTWNIGVFRIVPEFAIGVAMRDLGRSFSFGSRRAALGVFWASFAAVLGLIASPAPASFIVLALAVLIFAAADAERHGGLKPLAHAFPVLLGEVSYAVYMLHTQFGILFFDQFLGLSRSKSSVVAAVTIGIAIALVTVLSYLSHRFYELPTREFLIARARGLSPRLAPKGE